MCTVSCELKVTVRPARAEDADSIAGTFLESAEYHACLDPERYSTPALEAITARYRDGRQHPAEPGGAAVTLVAEFEGDDGRNGEIVGFVDARLDQSLDAMHKRMLYCHIAEIAVSWRHRNQGIGRRLLQAAEEWGRRHGAKFASLEHHAANARAGGFYQQGMGYSQAAVTLIKRL